MPATPPAPAGLSQRHSIVMWTTCQAVYCLATAPASSLHLTRPHRFAETSGPCNAWELAVQSAMHYLSGMSRQSIAEVSDDDAYKLAQLYVNAWTRLISILQDSCDCSIAVPILLHLMQVILSKCNTPHADGQSSQDQAIEPGSKARLRAARLAWLEHQLVSILAPVSRPLLAYLAKQAQQPLPA